MEASEWNEDEGAAEAAQASDVMSTPKKKHRKKK
jgi:hypothetical protein